MKNLTLLGALTFAALAGAGGTASAALTGSDTVTVGFDGVPAAVYGHSNDAPIGGGACPPGIGLGPCYYEPSSGASSVAFGPASDSTSLAAHVHGDNYDAANPTNKGLAYHGDSAGIFFRMTDSSAFSFNSVLFHAPIDANNPGTGASAFWDIFGYSFATDPTITTDGSVPVATLTVNNGYDGTLTLPAAFNNVKSIWIHYNGYPQTPTDGATFKAVIDNVNLSAPGGTAPVPIPAAVWLFGSGLMGLLSVGKRKKIA